tara:strand:- start:625 stop:1173 length:549 start_codon:yes stop_codon:yes gene_type:complete
MLLVKANGSTVEVYPYSLGLLRKDNPYTGFPKNPSVEDMAAFGVYPVTEIQPETIGQNQKLSLNMTPTLSDNKEWVLSHGVIDLTPEEIAAAANSVVTNTRKAIASAVQSVLNESSQARNYDSIISECSYATSTGTFGAEAQATVDWRDAVWTHVYNVEAAVIAGSREAPTVTEMLASLPTR